MELVWAQIGMYTFGILRELRDSGGKVAQKKGLAMSADERDYPTGNAAVDLESFAKHAGRSTIKTDDVMLLARRNEGLAELLKEELKNIESSKQAKEK